MPRRGYGPLPSPLQVNKGENEIKPPLTVHTLLKLGALIQTASTPLKSKIYTHDTYLGMQSKKQGRLYMIQRYFNITGGVFREDLGGQGGILLPH